MVCILQITSLVFTFIYIYICANLHPRCRIAFYTQPTRQPTFVTYTRAPEPTRAPSWWPNPPMDRLKPTHARTSKPTPAPIIPIGCPKPDTFSRSLCRRRQDLQAWGRPAATAGARDPPTPRSTHCALRARGAGEETRSPRAGWDNGSGSRAAAAERRWGCGNSGTLQARALLPSAPHPTPAHGSRAAPSFTCRDDDSARCSPSSVRVLLHRCQEVSACYFSRTNLLVSPVFLLVFFRLSILIIPAHGNCIFYVYMVQEEVFCSIQVAHELSLFSQLFYWTLMLWVSLVVVSAYSINNFLLGQYYHGFFLRLNNIPNTIFFCDYWMVMMSWVVSTIVHL